MDSFFHIARTKQDRNARKKAKIDALGAQSRIKPILRVLADDTAYIEDNRLMCQGRFVRNVSNKLISVMNTGGYIKHIPSTNRWLPIW